MSERAKVYADALYEVACEDSCVEQMMAEVRTVGTLLEEQLDYLRLLADPSLAKQERVGLIDRCFAGQISGNLLNFLKILCENGAIREYSACARVFTQRYYEAHGILEVTVWTAVPLDRRQADALKAKLQQVTGKQIVLSARIDKRLLGGIRLEYEGKMLDGTVLSRLRGIEKNLKALRFE